MGARRVVVVDMAPNGLGEGPLNGHDGRMPLFPEHETMVSKEIQNRGGVVQIRKKISTAGKWVRGGSYSC